MKYNDFIELKKLDRDGKKILLENIKNTLTVYKIVKYINLTGIALSTQNVFQGISDYITYHNPDLLSKGSIFIETASIIGYLSSTYMINNALEKKATLETLINIEQEKSR